jgi:hypothetical protein
MAEFLHRQINVAIPEVDVGDDVFVVRGTDDAVTRVQVKTANGTAQMNSYYAQFSIPLNQLQTPDTPALVYVFVVRHAGRWSDFVVIRRGTLDQLRVNRGIGSISARDGVDSLKLRLVFTDGDVQASGVGLQDFRNAFEPWPPHET